MGPDWGQAWRRKCCTSITAPLPRAERSLPALHTGTNSSLTLLQEANTAHLGFFSRHWEEWGREAGLSSSGHSVQPVPALRRTGRSFSNQTHLCDQAQEFPALLQPSWEEAARRMCQVPPRTWHRGQETTESSNPGLRNERIPCTPVIHGEVTGAQAGSERPTVSLCILPALECQPCSSSKERCHVPSFPGSPLQASQHLL